MHQAQWSPERPLPPPVSLASQSHREKPPEVTCTRRGTPGFPASTRERPRETFFNTSRGQIPLPWLGSNDALPLATRMETRLPWHPTRGSLPIAGILQQVPPRTARAGDVQHCLDEMSVVFTRESPGRRGFSDAVVGGTGIEPVASTV